METFVAPNGKVINIPKGRIIAYGLSHEEIQIVKRSIPSNEFEVYVPDAVTDILAIDHDSLIIKSSEISAEEWEMITDYYTELGGSFDETVFRIGYPKPPSRLRPKFCCYQNFGELSYILPSKLKEAHQKMKNARAFSKRMMDCFMIRMPPRNGKFLNDVFKNYARKDVLMV